MTQNLNVALPTLEYTRTDYTALRAWIQRLPLERIGQIYYAPDAPQVLFGLERFLIGMRHQLIERAIEANPKLAEGLAKARLGGPMNGVVLDVLIKAAEAKPATPHPSDSCARWFRPTTVRAIRALPGVKTLHDLKAAIEQGGTTWWRPVPRFGKKRAQAVVDWLNRQPSTAVSQSAWCSASPCEPGLMLSTQPLPLERIAGVPHEYDGSQGINRGQNFCLIQARNDLQAVQDYLHRFRQTHHTLRAYQRELERLLLWCVIVRRKPLSSMLSNDCEAYIDFLREPRASFCGPGRSRLSPQWRPFEGPLSEVSCRQAVMIIRQAFGWLQDVRYLGANPWVVVNTPKSVKHDRAMQVHKALHSDLWDKVQKELQRQSESDLPAQLSPQAWRLGGAILLLLGHTGLRISEAAAAQREHLSRSPDAPVWQLRVLGKGNKWRTVYFGARVMSALREHWRDLDEVPATLVSPFMRPPTPAAMRKELNGFHPVALAKVVTRTLHGLAGLDDAFTEDEKTRLMAATAHKLRHTFGVVALEREMPLDVLQQLLGHASASTTAIYTRAHERRLAQEVNKIYALST